MLCGFDASHEALAATRRNAAAAGVAALLTLEQRQLWQMQRPVLPEQKARGLLICNPPYGERLGEKGTTRELYRALGRIASEQLPGWQACVLGADVQHVDALGLRHRATERLHNGAITVYARFGDVVAALPQGVTRF